MKDDEGIFWCVCVRCAHFCANAKVAMLKLLYFGIFMPLPFDRNDGLEGCRWFEMVERSSRFVGLFDSVVGSNVDGNGICITDADGGNGNSFFFYKI